MHSIKLNVQDSIYAHIMFLLNNLSSKDLEIVEITTDNSQNLDNLTDSIATALSEVEKSKSTNKSLTNAWDLLDEL